MIKDRAKDVLIMMGMPASVLGIEYIAEAMELFDSGFHDIKIMVLYEKIGKRHNTTSTGVERAIRHAFGSVITRGRNDVVEKYLSFDNTSNSNMLKLLYYRLKQEECETANSKSPETKKVINSDPYQVLEDDMVLAVQKFVKNLREANSNVCCKTDQRTLRELQGI